ncbi:hypothetical protein [Endozoicomonas sp. ONNA2]|uniref:hypothetical protein n=1 Tax=Endozoicomonas sp. ONNA2 TaxID=2828741 RepID=UPI002147668E|nr:hypothetical protein [Endozoicomonas sp. ONNA2]
MKTILVAVTLILSIASSYVQAVALVNQNTNYGFHFPSVRAGGGYLQVNSPTDFNANGQNGDTAFISEFIVPFGPNGTLGFTFSVDIGGLQYRLGVSESQTIVLNPATGPITQNEIWGQLGHIQSPTHEGRLAADFSVLKSARFPNFYLSASHTGTLLLLNGDDPNFRRQRPESRVDIVRQ